MLIVQGRLIVYPKRDHQVKKQFFHSRACLILYSSSSHAYSMQWMGSCIYLGLIQVIVPCIEPMGSYPLFCLRSRVDTSTLYGWGLPLNIIKPLQARAALGFCSNMALGPASTSSEIANSWRTTTGFSSVNIPEKSIQIVSSVLVEKQWNVTQCALSCLQKSWSVKSWTLRR